MTMSPSVRWQKDRNEINHDWLKNQYLMALGRLVAILAGRVESAMPMKAVRSGVAAWSRRRKDVRSLLRRFEDEMSPRQLLLQQPLRNCAPHTKEWLAPLVHDLWLARESVPELIEVATGCVDRVDHAYVSVMAALHKRTSLAVDDKTEAVVEQLRSACESLSTAISAFPHSVKVV